MIWVAVLLLAGAALAPLALVLRGQAQARGRRDSALDLHRSQLAELDRDLADGRIAPAEHATALLEVQRRLLAAAASADPAAERASRGPVLAVLVLVPLAAVLLYLVGGSPDLPAAPLSEMRAVHEQRAAEGARLAAQLRRGLAGLDPRSDQARQGYVLLGGIEEARGDYAAAAAAWRTALAARFDPTLAAQTADAASRAEGRVSDESAALFRRALQEAPADAPWRSFVEQRLAGAG